MPGFSLPSASLLAQSILSGIFVGALYGLLGLGLSLSWGLLRLINLAHFAFAFLAAYLCYQMATMGLDPLLTLAVIVPLFFVIGAGLHAAMARFEMTPFNSLLMTGTCSALASVAGVCLALGFTLAPSQIYAWIGVVFAAVMLGGLGRAVAPLIAGVVIGVSEAVTMAVTAPSWAPLVSFTLLI